MKIKTIIDRYRAHERLPNAAKTPIQNALTAQLEKDIEALGGNYTFIYTIIKLNGSFHPDVVQEFFTKMGIEELERLDSWLEPFSSINNDYLCGLLLPEMSNDFPVTPLPRAQITSLLSDCHVKDGWQLHYTDPNYQMISLPDLHRVVQDCPSDRYQYLRSIRDCENFSFITLGYLAQIGLGNLACGYVEVEYMRDNRVIYAHALNIAVAHDGTTEKNPAVYFIEPQNDDIYSAKNPKLPFGIDKTVIRKILM